MGSIKVQKLTKSFGIHTVFKDVSFELHRGERLGLIGANGAGKSTLLKCLIGEEEYDDGNFIVSAGETVGYLQQNITYDAGLTLRQLLTEAWQDVLRLEKQLKETEQVMRERPQDTELMGRYARMQEKFEWLGGFAYESMSRKIVQGLGFSAADMERPVQEFSGGQKTRINLAKALVRRPDYLFLDEPTNHLDVDMLEWLETYLLSYEGGILIVSHDRYFLDRVATGILDLADGGVKKYKGNYTQYKIQYRQQRDALEKAYQKQQEHIRETEDYIRKYKAGIKAKQARGRQSQLNRLERIDLNPEAATLKFSFSPAVESGQKVLVVDDVCGGYTGKPLFSHLSLSIRRGETVALVGANGTGKTSLLKLIMGETTPTSGHIVWGSRVQPGYFSQEHTEFNGRTTVLAEIMDTFSYGEEEARSVLGRFLFRGDEVDKTIGALSGGEQARLALLKLFLQGPNFLILDEPTNHLDIPTREILEKALLDFGGTYLVVSHDRYFLDTIAGRTLVLENRTVKEYLGNYSYYREKRQEEQQAAQEKAEPATAIPKKKEATGKIRASEHIKKSAPSSYGKEKQLETIEMKIAELEATVKMYEVQLSLPENMADSQTLMTLNEQYEKTVEALQQAYEKWETLAE